MIYWYIYLSHLILCFLSLLSLQGPKVSSKSVFCSSDNHLIIRGHFTHYLSEWSFAHIRNVMKEASELCFRSSKLYRMLFYISLMCNNDVLVGFQGKAPFSSSNWDRASLMIIICYITLMGKKWPELLHIVKSANVLNYVHLALILFYTYLFPMLPHRVSKLASGQDHIVSVRKVFPCEKCRKLCFVLKKI